MRFSLILSFSCLFVWIFVATNSQPLLIEKQVKNPDLLSSSHILEKSRQQFDPDSNWNRAEFRLHIREPRPQTPARYSELILNNQTGYFRLSREYEVGEIVRLVDESGISEILLNGSDEISDDVIEKYRLYEEGNYSYRNFYKIILGLPVTLNDQIVREIGKTGSEIYNGTEVYNISVELNEPLISKRWELLISKNDYRIRALRFVHAPEDEKENEIIIFEGEYSTDGMKIPRFRHWYLEESNEYLGSDLILGEIPGL